MKSNNIGMMAHNIPFSPPGITQIEIGEAVETLTSGWITTGPKTEELERLIAEKSGTDRAVCLNSNTACAEMILRILDIEPSDEVIVPACTYTASAFVVNHVGAKIVLADYEKDKSTVDYEKLEVTISFRTKVIIPVNISGVPADYGGILEIVSRKKYLFNPSDNKIQQAIGRVIITSDEAHCLGATYRGKPVAQYPDFINYSWYTMKNLTTAEGGIITWRSIPDIDNSDLYHQYMLLNLHEQSKDVFAKTKLGVWEYGIVGPWYKYNMTDVYATVGLEQMKRYDRVLVRHKEITGIYLDAFTDLLAKVLNHYTKGYSTSGYLYITRLSDRDNAAIDTKVGNGFIARMTELGVAANVHYKPLPMHIGYKKLGLDIRNYPNAYEQFKNEVTLPLHIRLSDEDMEYIIWAVKKAASEILM